MVEEIKLNEKDLKLLAYTYHNARDPLTKIARELKLSREQVEYRIRKFEASGIIKGYIPIINYGRLGYKHISIIFIKFNRFSSAEDFKAKYDGKNRISTIELSGRFDIAMMLVFKDEIERNKIIFEMIQEDSGIIDYKIIEPFFTELYPLKNLGNSKYKSHLMIDHKDIGEKLDKKDIKILKVLNENAKARIIDISKATNLSAELIVYKMAKMKERNILIGTRAYFDMQKLGYFYTILFLSFNNFSDKMQERLKHFSSVSRHIEGLSFMFGKPNAYIQLFHKEEKELRTTLDDLRKAFKEEFIDIEIMLLKNEGEDVDVLPFL